MTQEERQAKRRARQQTNLENTGFKSNFNANLSKDGWQGAFDIANTAMNLGSSFIPQKEDSQLSSQMAIGNGLMSSGIPALQGVGLAFNAASMLENGLGLNGSNITQPVADAAGFSEFAKVGNNLTNKIPFLSALAGTKTSDFIKSSSLDNVNGAFGDAMNKINAAEDTSSKRFIFGGNKINRLHDTALDYSNRLIPLAETNSAVLNGASEVARDIQNREYIKKQGMLNSNIAFSKNGTKLPSKEELKRILNGEKDVEVNIASLKNGGVVGVDSNIIPEGKLHAHKHHLDEVNPELEDVTKKGIPVISVDEKGEIEQVAEIEKEEIIFRKELTDKIEKLYKDNSDEAAIEAGKILAEELIINTDDNTETLLEDGDD